MKQLRMFGWVCLAAATIIGCRAETQAPADRPPSVQQGAPVDAASALEVIPVTILSGDARHVFETEVAASAEEQRRGMMFRESMAEDAGMIFPFDPPRPASFWMRNTLIPLDMIFIGEGGVILNIEREAEPLTLESRYSDGPVIAVLEIAGGRAEQLGIEAGDRVGWPGGPELDTGASQ